MHVKQYIIAVCAVVSYLSLPANARITRIEIDATRSERPAPDTNTIANVGAVERLVGTAYGELDPNDRRNALIQDIALAPRNARGMVEYATSFTLIKPADMTKASGFLFYEAVNRGNELVPRLFGAGDESGDTFLLKKGMVILRAGWEGDLPPEDQGNWGGRTYSMKVPVAKNKDGTSITGPVLIRIFNFKGTTSPLPVRQRAVPYIPNSLDTRMAVLTSRATERLDGTGGPVTTVPSDEWAFADCTTKKFPGVADPRHICLKNGFDPNELYQLVFTAKDPLVLGIGFAATRDVTAFFKHAKADDAGRPNPVAGRISYAIGNGSSQTGQFVRTYINLGFNEDESGRIVWDGAIPNIAGRQLGLNLRFALPDGGPTPYVPDAQGALWWTDWADPVRHHAAAGLLHRCQATKTCPKIFETFGSSELWGIRMSAGLAGTTGHVDVPLPENVRRYFSPSTTHGGGAGGFSVARDAAATSPMGTCVWQGNPNPQSDTLRALTVAMTEWIAHDVPPPPSNYPHISDGTLVAATKAAVHFPDIPNAPFLENSGNPVFDYDFGSELIENDVSGVLTKLPPVIKGVIRVRVPTVNSDGNETAGVPSVLLQAPLGTYLGWNVTASGYYKGQMCSFVGGYIPFAVTKSAREVERDPRPSLQERYGDHDGYVAAVRAATERSMRDRILLPDDAARLIQEAANSGILRQ